jgi:UDP-glucose 4-epimerase
MVIGGAGFIGSHLVDRLLAEQHTVDVVDDLSTGTLANLSAARAAGGDLKIHHLDVCADEFPSLVAMRTPDVIFHLGWLVPGRSDPAALARAVHGMLNVVESSRLLGSAKIVVAASASSVYGDVPVREQPVKEGRPPGMSGPVGVISHAVLELLAAYRREHDVEFTALAMSSVYGPRQRRDGGVVAAFADSLHRREAPVIRGDGRQTRDFLFIDDAVDACVRAGTRGGGLIINIGTGTATSVRDLWALLAGPDPSAPRHEPTPSGDVARLALSPTRARIQLSWAPWTSLDVGLRSVGRPPG